MGDLQQILPGHMPCFPHLSGRHNATLHEAPCECLQWQVVVLVDATLPIVTGAGKAQKGLSQNSASCCRCPARVPSSHCSNSGNAPPELQPSIRLSASQENSTLELLLNTLFTLNASAGTGVQQQGNKVIIWKKVGMARSRIYADFYMHP